MNKHIKLLPYKTILRATQGDIQAIGEILLHFGKYIDTLATHEFYDPYGNMRLIVDNDLRRRLEVKLITAIFKFDALIED